MSKKVKVDNDHEMTQSERNYNSKNLTKLTISTKRKCRKTYEQLSSNRR